MNNDRNKAKLMLTSDNKTITDLFHRYTWINILLHRNDISIFIIAAQSNHLLSQINYSIKDNRNMVTAKKNIPVILEIRSEIFWGAIYTQSHNCKYKSIDL